MNNNIRIGIVLLVMIWVAIFVVAIRYSFSNDYIIKNYGQGVFSIEHDGVIHVQGKGEPNKSEDEGVDNAPHVQTDLEKAQKSERNGEWYYALRYYQDAGETEKMKEMALKEVKESIANRNYEYASGIVLRYLKDKDLAMEYYEKHIDQKLNN